MNFNRLILVFLVLLAVECWAAALDITALEYFSKPLLMVTLLAYFLSNSTNTDPARSFIAAALCFSWLGDVLLLVEKTYSFLFIFGLTAFLAAHAAYVMFFWRIRKRNISKPGLRKFPVVAVFGYMALLFAVLLPNLGFLWLPVMLYSIVISLMLITCVHAFNFEEQAFGFICLIGTILFVVSDSVLAVNRFVTPIKLGPALVMLTYSLGQLLIAEGAIRNLRRLGPN